MNGTRYWVIQVGKKTRTAEFTDWWAAASWAFRFQMRSFVVGAPESYHVYIGPATHAKMEAKRLSKRQGFQLQDVHDSTPR